MCLLIRMFFLFICNVPKSKNYITFFLRAVDNTRVKREQKGGIVRKTDMNLPLGGLSGHRDENVKKRDDPVK